MHINYMIFVKKLISIMLLVLLGMSLIACHTANYSHTSHLLTANDTPNSEKPLEYLTIDRVLEIYNQEELYCEGSFDDAPIYNLDDIKNSGLITFGASNLDYLGNVNFSISENKMKLVCSKSSSLSKILTAFPTNIVRTTVPSNEITSNNEKFLYIGYRLDNGCRLILYCNKYSLENYHAFAFAPIIYSHINSEQEYIDLIENGASREEMMAFDPYLSQLETTTEGNFVGKLLTTQGMKDIHFYLKNKSYSFYNDTYGNIEFYYYSDGYQRREETAYYGTYDLVPQDW